MAISAFQSSDTELWPIHLGLWTNWSLGPVMGKTLTLRRQDADLLIAFTAFFISWVGTRFWRILCFVCHRRFSSKDPQDGLYQQRQVILRNSASPEDGLWRLAQLHWHWRGVARSRLRRLLPICLVASASIAAFVVAGGYSSRMSTFIGDEVLINGENCGLIGSPSGGDGSVYAHLDIWRAKITATAHNYAQQCYIENSTTSADCTRFIVPRLKGLKTDSSPCPFDGNICRSNSSNLVLDSGYMDSHYDFGINSAPEDRILMRNRIECAPLKTEGYEIFSQINGFDYASYDFGSRIPDTNYTYEILTRDMQYAHERNGAKGVDYRLAAFLATMLGKAAHLSMSSFLPGPVINRTDGDIALYFLSANGVRFQVSSQDDWYRAVDPYGSSGVIGATSHSTLYRPDTAAAPLACVEQLQFCNYKKDCGPMAGMYDAAAGAANIFNTTEELVTWNGSAPTRAGTRFIWFVATLEIFPKGTFDVVSSMGAQALGSHSGLSGGVQGPLAVDQWKQDVTNWWATALSTLQNAFVELARGPTDSVMVKYRWPPSDQDQWDMCHNQKARSTNHGSFSVFALMFTYVTGLVITGISYSLEPILKCLHRRRTRKGYHYPEWITNADLQLQRLAYENSGTDDWSRCMEVVPITKPLVQLQGLDVSNAHHPRLYRHEGSKPEVSGSDKLLSDNGAINTIGERVTLPQSTGSGADSTVQRSASRKTI